MADQDALRGGSARSQCTEAAWQVGDRKIERRHFCGYPYLREHFVYFVKASWKDLCELGLTNGVCRPEGRKRVNGGSISEWEDWTIRAMKGGQWELVLRVNNRISSIEKLIAGRPHDPHHESWRVREARSHERRQAAKAQRDTAFQAFKNRLLGLGA